MILDHTIDRSVPIPLYYQLKMIIVDEINNGSYLADQPIPTEEELIRHFNLSRTTVRQAISELVQEGKLYRVKSKGTFISAPKRQQDFVIRLHSFNEMVRESGRTPHTKVLLKELISAEKDVADALSVPQGTQVYHLIRQRFADGTPLVVVESWFPADSFGFLEEIDLTEESIYETISRLHPENAVTRSKRSFEAKNADVEMASLLNVTKGRALLRFVSTAYSDEKPLEYSIAYYNPDANHFEMTVNR